MDLAACAKRVFIILEHVTRDGSSRLVTSCDLPVTARGVVTLVATNYGLFEPTGSGFRLREIAPGLTVEEIRAATGGTLTVADGLREISIRRYTAFTWGGPARERTDPFPYRFLMMILTFMTKITIMSDRKLRCFQAISSSR
jgi:hypothetical protein